MGKDIGLSDNGGSKRKAPSPLRHDAEPSGKKRKLPVKHTEDNSVSKTTPTKVYGCAMPSTEAETTKCSRASVDHHPTSSTLVKSDKFSVPSVELLRKRTKANGATGKSKRKRAKTIGCSIPIVEQQEASPEPPTDFMKESSPPAPPKSFMQRKGLYTPPSWNTVIDGSLGIYLECIKNGVMKDTIYLKERGYWVFGREPTLVQVTCSNPFISRQHAVLQFKQPNELYIFDMGTAHGTKINNKRVHPYRFFRVYAGDIIKFAKSTRMYVICCDSTDLRRPRIIQAEKNAEERERKQRQEEIKKMRKMLEEREEKEKLKGQEPGFLDMLNHMKEIDQETAKKAEMSKKQKKRALEQKEQAEGNSEDELEEDAGLEKASDFVRQYFDDGHFDDDDDYFDRVKRKKKIIRHKRKNNVQDFESLCKERDRLQFRLSEIRISLRDVKRHERYNKRDDKEKRTKENKIRDKSDTLDEFMASMKRAPKQSRDKLFREKNEINQRLTQTLKLIEITRPADWKLRQEIKAKQKVHRENQIKDLEEWTEIKPTYTRTKKVNGLNAQIIQQIRKEEKEREEHERLATELEEKHRIKKAEALREQQAAKVNEMKEAEKEPKFTLHNGLNIPKRRQKQQQPITVPEEQEDDEEDVEKEFPPIKRTKDTVPLAQGEDFESELDQMDIYEKANMDWTAPEGQCGDGRTELNEKFGY